MKIRFDFSWFNSAIDGIENFSMESDIIPQIGSQFDFEFKDNSGEISFKVNDIIYNYSEKTNSFSSVTVFLIQL